MREANGHVRVRRKRKIGKDARADAGNWRHDAALFAESVNAIPVVIE
jgi:hypothetical protein